MSTRLHDLVDLVPTIFGWAAIVWIAFRSAGLLRNKLRSRTGSVSASGWVVFFRCFSIGGVALVGIIFIFAQPSSNVWKSVMAAVLVSLAFLEIGTEVVAHKRRPRVTRDPTLNLGLVSETRNGVGVAATETALDRLSRLRREVPSIEAELDVPGDYGESTIVFDWENRVKAELRGIGRGAVERFSETPTRQDLGIAPHELYGVNALKVRLLRSDFVLGEVLSELSPGVPTQANQRVHRLEYLYLCGIALRALDADPGFPGGRWIHLVQDWASGVANALPEANLVVPEPLHDDSNEYTPEEYGHFAGLVDRLMGPLREAYETRNG